MNRKENKFQTRRVSYIEGGCCVVVFGEPAIKFKLQTNRNFRNVLKSRYRGGRQHTGLTWLIIPDKYDLYTRCEAATLMRF